MMRLLAAMLMAVLISTGLVSLIAVLVLPPSATPHALTPRPPQPVPFSLRAPTIARNTDILRAGDAARQAPAMPSSTPVAPTVVPLFIPLEPSPPREPQVTVASGTAPPMEQPSLPPPQGNFALPLAAAQPSVDTTAVALNEAVSSPLPRYRVEPRYPPRAQRANLEGYVRLGFSITPQGRVTDIQVLDAKPAGIFERAAIQALKRWRYAPQPQQGDAPPRQSIKLVFELNGRQP